MGPVMSYVFIIGLKVIYLFQIVESDIVGEECIGWTKEGGPILCYECLTDSNVKDNYCDDPFNATDPRVNMTVCDGYCVKWIRSPREGLTRYQRTCSDRLNLKLIIMEVCVQESRPRHGHMCFCSQHRCNAGNLNFPDVLRAAFVIGLAINVILWNG